MKTVKTINDPEAFKLLADGTRRKIVFLLRVKEMTVAKIAEELDLTPQAVYHHIKKLVDGGMVEVTREERVAHLIESYYRATAETFQCAVGKTSRGKETIKEEIAASLDALKKLGFKIEYNEKTISQLADLEVEMNECCSGEKYEDAISELDDVDFVTKLRVEEYVATISMSDEEIAEQHEIEKKFRNLLHSLVKK